MNEIPHGKSHNFIYGKCQIWIEMKIEWLLSFCSQLLHGLEGKIKIESSLNRNEFLK